MLKSIINFDSDPDCIDELVGKIVEIQELIKTMLKHAGEKVSVTTILQSSRWNII